MRTSRFISILLISLVVWPISARDKDEEPIPQAPFFCGAAVKVDLAGPVMKVLRTKYDQLEVGARLNFRDHYFPIAELGIGECERNSKTNNSQFKTRAPFFRVGMDYNLNRKHNGNRFFAGARYGLSRFNFDFTDPDFRDPIWGNGQEGLNIKGQKATTHWAEFCLGCETKIWSFIRLGWTLRFKARLKQKAGDYGDPYYTPGFGKNGNTCWGGTAQLIFDVGRTTKRAKRQVTVQNTTITLDNQQEK
ncbi:MAG: hypothetical protein HUK02_10335 [Bacteroidaceae bacterium]|nr:hypothetical protein [Bacteroidaceae bacterium]